MFGLRLADIAWWATMPCIVKGPVEVIILVLCSYHNGVGDAFELANFFGTSSRMAGVRVAKNSVAILVPLVLDLRYSLIHILDGSYGIRAGSNEDQFFRVVSVHGCSSDADK
jgi:hypothetical protein